MKRHEARTEIPLNYIEISSALKQRPPTRDALEGFLDKWRESEAFQKAGEIAFSEKPPIIGALKAAGKMAENSELMEDAMETMKIVCKDVARVGSRKEFLLRFLSEEKTLKAVAREYLLWELAKGLGFAQRPEIQRFLSKQTGKVDPKDNGFILERTPDGKAIIYYSNKHSGPGKGFPFKMWPPVFLPEDSEIGLALYFLTSSWGLIKQEETPLTATS